MAGTPEQVTDKTQEDGRASRVLSSLTRVQLSYRLQNRKSLRNFIDFQDRRNLIFLTEMINTYTQSIDSGAKSKVVFWIPALVVEN